MKYYAVHEHVHVLIRTRALRARDDDCLRARSRVCEKRRDWPKQIPTLGLVYVHNIIYPYQVYMYVQLVDGPLYVSVARYSRSVCEIVWRRRD